MGDRKERGAPPASGNVSLPFEINKSKTVTAETLESLYHTSERGQQGAFPLGITAQFHSGADLLVERGKPICSIAYGEVVAARIGVGTGEHPWGEPASCSCAIRSRATSPSSVSSCTCSASRSILTAPMRAGCAGSSSTVLTAASRSGG